MKRKIITFFAVLFLSLPIFGQGLSIGPSVGYIDVNSSDYFTSGFENGEFDLSTGLRYGLKARASLPLLPFTFTGHIYYASITVDGSYEGTTFESESSLLNAAIGAEWNLLPGPIRPYAALDILYSKTGDVSFSTLINGQVFEESNDGSSRTGLGIGVGATITLIPVIDLDASVKYNFNNLFGKEDGEENLNTYSFMVSVLFDIL